MNLHLVIGAGLAGIKSVLIADYIGPAFLIAVAVFAIMEARNRQWMKLFGLIAVAAVVGVLVYGGSGLFGSSTSGLSGVASGVAKNVDNSSGFGN